MLHLWWYTVLGTRWRLTGRVLATTWCLGRDSALAFDTIRLCRGVWKTILRMDSFAWLGQLAEYRSWRWSSLILNCFRLPTTLLFWWRTHDFGLIRRWGSDDRNVDIRWLLCSLWACTVPIWLGNAGGRLPIIRTGVGDSVQLVVETEHGRCS
jgi:hypothetical protein